MVQIQKAFPKSLIVWSHYPVRQKCTLSAAYPDIFFTAGRALMSLQTCSKRFLLKVYDYFRTKTDANFSRGII